MATKHKRKHLREYWGIGDMCIEISLECHLMCLESLNGEHQQFTEPKRLVLITYWILLRLIGEDGLTLC